MSVKEREKKSKFSKSFQWSSIESLCRIKAAVLGPGSFFEWGMENALWLHFYARNQRGFQVSWERPNQRVNPIDYNGHWETMHIGIVSFIDTL